MAIYTLPEQDVRDFLASYELFEQEHVSGNGHDAENTVNYYKVLNHLCAVGEVEKMYIPPVMDPSLNIFENQLLWEEAMAERLNLVPGSRVLDMGCGRGRVAHHVASYSGAHVTGLNIDRTQVHMAQDPQDWQTHTCPPSKAKIRPRSLRTLVKHSMESRKAPVSSLQDFANVTGLLDKQLRFVHGNFNDPLPFPDESFDALYQVRSALAIPPTRILTLRVASGQPVNSRHCFHEHEGHRGRPAMCRDASES